ncbi:unnamed protein product, partial [Rotaria sordida]
QIFIDDVSGDSNTNIVLICANLAQIFPDGISGGITTKLAQIFSNGVGGGLPLT